MELFHQGLRDLLLLNEYNSERKVGFLSIEVPLPDLLKKITQSIPNYSLGLHLRREYRHICMGINAVKYKNVDTLLVFEAYNQHLFFLLPLLALTNKKVLIMLHGNQQFAMSSKFKNIGLIYLKIFLKMFPNFKAILLEVDDDIIPEKFRLPSSSKIIIPHPLIAEATPNLMPGERLSTEDTIKIGVVGMIREDKPIAKLIEKIQDYIGASDRKCELIIGTPFSQKPKYLEKLQVKLYDTTKQEDYISVLKQIDILVIHYDKERYYYRTSGVISDAASCGCYVVASDYPVIKHQINFPVEVGTTFSNFDEIGSCIDRGINFIREKGQDNHWIWREKRTAKYISTILDKANLTPHSSNV